MQEIFLQNDLHKKSIHPFGFRGGVFKNSHKIIWLHIVSAYKGRALYIVFLEVIFLERQNTKYRIQNLDPPSNFYTSYFVLSLLYFVFFNYGHPLCSQLAVCNQGFWLDEKSIRNRSSNVDRIGSTRTNFIWSAKRPTYPRHRCWYPYTAPCGIMGTVSDHRCVWPLCLRCTKNFHRSGYGCSYRTSGNAPQHSDRGTRWLQTDGSGHANYHQRWWRLGDLAPKASLHRSWIYDDGSCWDEYRCLSCWGIWPKCIRWNPRTLCDGAPCDCRPPCGVQKCWRWLSASCQSTSGNGGVSY